MLFDEHKRIYPLLYFKVITVFSLIKFNINRYFIGDFTSLMQHLVCSTIQGNIISEFFIVNTIQKLKERYKVTFTRSVSSNQNINRLQFQFRFFMDLYPFISIESILLLFVICKFAHNLPINKHVRSDYKHSL